MFYDCTYEVYCQMGNDDTKYFLKQMSISFSSALKEGTNVRHLIDISPKSSWQYLRLMEVGFQAPRSPSWHLSQPDKFIKIDFCGEVTLTSFIRFGVKPIFGFGSDVQSFVLPCHAVSQSHPLSTFLKVVKSLHQLSKLWTAFISYQSKLVAVSMSCKRSRLLASYVRAVASLYRLSKMYAAYTSCQSCQNKK